MDHIAFQQRTDRQTSLFEPEAIEPERPGRKPGTENEEKGPPFDISIGAILKDERQKKGLDYGQISEKTKIRPHILQALENEEWDLLPPPFFVKGFVRSYAQAVGLDEQEVVSLYQKAAPVESIQQKPLGEPVRDRKALSVVLILLLLAMASGYFLWKGYMPGKETSMRSQVIYPADNSMANSEPVREVPAMAEILHLNKQKELSAGPVMDSMETSTQTEKGLAQTVPAPEATTGTIDIEPPGDFMDVKAETISSAEQMSAPASETGSGPEIIGLILKANVREKTWVKIFVDEQEPKEYILSPGANPEWEAKEGFELLVGNAGGISLEFNGEQVKDLGNSGQVVRLSLPEGYKRENLQE